MKFLLKPESDEEAHSRDWEYKMIMMMEDVPLRRVKVSE